MLARLRAEKATPVLVLTASSTLDKRLARFDDGADDFLSKPFAVSELAARLRALIRRGRAIVSGAIEFDSLMTDSQRMEVRIGNRTIDLTRGELEILEPLIHSAGRVVPREILVDRLSQDVAEGSNAVDVHIHNLRRKLSADRIRTRRGVGNVFDMESR